MNIYVYSDESGVFDKINNDLFIYGGVIFLNKDDMINSKRKFLNVEHLYKEKYLLTKFEELKATNIQKKDRSKIFRSLNNVIKFSVIVNQKELMDEIFSNKRLKRNYINYAFSVGLKECLKTLIEKNILIENQVENIYLYFDETTIATNAKYNLEDSIYAELKIGKFNKTYDNFYPPLFSNVDSITIKHCKSKNVTLIRMADFVVNKVYSSVKNNENEIMEKVYIKRLP